MEFITSDQYIDLNELKNSISTKVNSAVTRIDMAISSIYKLVSRTEEERIKMDCEIKDDFQNFIVNSKYKSLEKSLTDSIGIMHSFKLRLRITYDKFLRVRNMLQNIRQNIKITVKRSVSKHQKFSLEKFISYQHEAEKKLTYAISNLDSIIGIIEIVSKGASDGIFYPKEYNIKEKKPVMWSSVMIDIKRKIT